MVQDIAVILLHRQGQVLLQHRTDDAPEYASKWGFFGGRVEAGETPDVAVVRECKEELDYDLARPVLVYRGLIKTGATIHVFIEEYDGRKALSLNEGQEMRWMAVEEASGLDMIEHDRVILLGIKDNLC